MAHIVIDPEFRAALPPLDSEELAQLEENILRDGCLDALAVWQVHSEDILLDGYNRYEICTRHGVPFRTVIIAVSSREEVLSWIVRMQLGRRNLTQFVRGELVLKLKTLVAAQLKASRNVSWRPEIHLSSALMNTSSPPQVPHQARSTQAILAEMAGVGVGTLANIALILKDGAPEVIEAARSGELPIEPGRILAKLPQSDQAAALDAATQVADGKKVSSTARQKSFIVLGRQWTACVGPSKGLSQHGIKVRDKRQHPLLQILH